MLDFEMDMDLEMLSDSFLEEMEKIKDLVEEISDYQASEEEDEEESEYREVYGGTKEEMKEYQEKFREYVESIKEGLEKIYRDMEKNKRNEEIEPKMKSPWERGHKLGCGCPGCTAYKEFYGIKLDENKNYQSSQIKPDLRLASNKPEKKKYSEETDSRPCGGKHYHLFHGGEAELKTVLGNHMNRFNFKPMGY